jgi:hypothetical protein
MIDFQAHWKRLSELLFKKQFTSSASMGLSITDSEISCAVYDFTNKNQGGLKCIKIGSIPYQSTKPLSAAFIDLQNHFGITNIKCAWTLSPKDYQLLLIDKPKVMPKEYRAVALWQVKDMLEFPIADCVVDVFLPSENIPVHKNKLYVVVSKRSYLMSVVEILNSINISVESIIIREFAERNMVVNLGVGEETVSMLSRDGETYVLTIFKNQEILFSRRISKNLEYELMRSFEYFNVTLNQSPLTKLFTYNMTLEEQVALKTNLEQSNFIIPIEDIKTKYEKLGVSKPEEMEKNCYAVGAALQFTIEAQ